MPEPGYPPKFRKYRKRPVVIEAMRMDVPFHCETPEGMMTGREGDWMVIGIEGETYPVAHEIFMKTYEEVEDED